MTTPPLPIDVSGIAVPLPDPGHEAIRVAALNAIVKVAELHQALMDTVTAQGEQIAALQEQVAALTPPPLTAPTTA